MSAREPIPVSVLVGFLGAGKTTVLNHILSAQHGRKIAVIVNEFGEINVDAKLVRHTTERMIEMSNGCICCTLRDDLLQELKALSQVPRLEYVLIESTGIGEPLPIAQTFYMDDLPERVRLDSIITVVDAVNFWRDYQREDTIEDAEGNPAQEPLAPLLIDQLEFTNIVLLNKSDCVNQAELDKLQGFVHALNPSAKIFHTVCGAIDPQQLINTELYDYEKGAEAQDWDLEWNTPSSEVAEYGFGSFVYSTQRPLIWKKFMSFVENDFPDQVMRTKGIVTFSDHHPILLQQAGEMCEYDELLPPDHDHSEEEHPASSHSPFEPDAELDTELVFIGQNLKPEKIKHALDACIAK